MIDTRRAVRRAAILSVACLPFCAAPAVAAPSWGIKVVPQNLYGGLGSVDPFSSSGEAFDLDSGQSRYAITVTNVATATTKKEEEEDTVPANATVTVMDHLPPGLSIVEGGGAGVGWHCQTANGATAVTCTKLEPTELKPGAAYPDVEVRGVAVAGNPLAPHESTAENEVAVSGGGASTVTAKKATTLVNLPFGIHEFRQDDNNEEGKPETLAGGHPFALNTFIELNYLPSVGGITNHLIAAGGSGFGQLGPKELQTELSPGLIGDVQNAPRCPLATFAERGGAGRGPCEKMHTEVGFLEAGYAASVTGAGQARPFCEPPIPIENCSPVVSRVFNLIPSAGHPAEFGFYVFGAPFVLVAKVRSDGDYGATVGDEATGPALGAKVTFCSYGVKSILENEKHEFEIGTCSKSSEAYEKAKEEHKEPPKPFLTNPTQCLTAPSTTLHANSWYEPADFVSKSIELPLLTGCKELTESFKGEVGKHEESTLEFKPSPAPEGSTSADQPTGMSLALRMPGTNPACEEPNPKTEPGVIRCPQSSAALKNLTMKLPPGLSLSPASAAPGQTSAEGLHACTNEQFGLGSSVEPTPPANCPLTSQIGTVEVFSPLLPKEADGSAPLKGALYVAAARMLALQRRRRRRRPALPALPAATRPQGRRRREAPRHRERQRRDGQVSTELRNQPQLPFEELILHLKGGPRAPLATSEACGAYTTTGALTPWSANEPGAASEIAGTRSSFNVACPSFVPL